MRILGIDNPYQNVKFGIGKKNIVLIPALVGALSGAPLNKAAAQVDGDVFSSTAMTAAEIKQSFAKKTEKGISSGDLFSVIHKSSKGLKRISVVDLEGNVDTLIVLKNLNLSKNDIICRGSKKNAKNLYVYDKSAKIALKVNEIEFIPYMKSFVIHTDYRKYNLSNSNFSKILKLAKRGKINPHIPTPIYNGLGQVSYIGDLSCFAP